MRHLVAVCDWAILIQKQLLGCGDDANGNIIPCGKGTKDPVRNCRP